ncbi:hypothetical protein RA210_U10418 [Rubrivivax sp. A210]|nr:hypothetical protein RA210_U10418 [Rubrivivax sp. A210]
MSARKLVCVKPWWLTKLSARGPN